MFKAFLFKIALMISAIAITLSGATLYLHANNYYGYVYHDYRITYDQDSPDTEQAIIKSIEELNAYCATHPDMESIDVSRYNEAYFVQRFLVLDSLLQISSGTYRYAVAGVHWNGTGYDIEYVDVTRYGFFYIDGTRYKIITHDMAARLHIIELRRSQMYQ